MAANQRYYCAAVKFAILFSDFIAALRLPSTNVQPEGINDSAEVKDSIAASAEQMPDHCNEFIILYIQERQHCPAVPPRDTLMDLMEDFCDWLLFSRLTSSVLLRQ